MITPLPSETIEKLDTDILLAYGKIVLAACDAFKARSVVDSSCATCGHEQAFHLLKRTLSLLRSAPVSQAEDDRVYQWERAHVRLDELGAPRSEGGNGITYSLRGRIDALLDKSPSPHGGAETQDDPLANAVREWIAATDARRALNFGDCPAPYETLKPANLRVQVAEQALRDEVLRLRTASSLSRGDHDEALIKEIEKAVNGGLSGAAAAWHFADLLRKAAAALRGDR